MLNLTIYQKWNQIFKNNDIKKMKVKRLRKNEKLLTV